MELSKGVEVILDNLENNPSCPHGPTIIFKRLVDGAEQKFYACSACRDRKDCNFFHNYEDEWTSKKKDSWDMRSKQLLPKIDRDELIERFQKVYQLPAADRSYCHTCGSLLLPEERADHASHELTKTITNHQLSHPSEVLKPLESAKKEAQYLFARKSTQAIVEMLRSAGIRNVVCVGAPRIHECIRNAYSSDMCSILLDFDHRYHQFYDGSEFAWFNAFNCHWFWGEIGKSATLEFLRKSDSQQLALVTDPPFGGRVEPLAYTFQRIDGFHKELHPNRENPLSLMWIFPYFMEPMILDSFSGMSMLDYKVDYDNHPLFQQGHKGRKYGSPVRIFTNIPLSKLPLPKDEGYRFCDFCEKWVSTENKHCFKCSNCTSKDGRTYVHCDKCARCVKPTWQHCKQCKRCCLPDHKCGEFKPSNCFACHKPGHKKNDCPSRKTLEGGDSANKKRIKKKKNKLSHGTSLVGQSQNTVDTGVKDKSTLRKRKTHQEAIAGKKRKISKKCE